ncbi:hypothetical protein A256_27413 [Pseudomonas syringae pv. actinidiae ICMP 19103]|nr:hypothetical protein PSYAC_17820 [Pseudomonas syringae pv. actinidiae str. M302091]EPM43402.1 hypothetical protein A256_27413 [Pseudomonas syringae pv. actinidiae ICMP 19103]EPM86419.1 hypothetical protein A260_16775 [Pseudomonas syringae pv. actinidiae ICMP 19068]EPM91719.1 hypothetical protein A259_38426 [Pseudomonas syringae pv. actinidiae ICMP 19070]EPM95471.1 hypothetical protein A258_16812 [Pseudomonas syringae pv. actinidiae ICMP 19104]EPM99751.1 hypothetical protein A253_27504 [Pseu
MSGCFFAIKQAGICEHECSQAQPDHELALGVGKLKGFDKRCRCRNRLITPRRNDNHVARGHQFQAMSDLQSDALVAAYHSRRLCTVTDLVSRLAGRRLGCPQHHSRHRKMEQADAVESQNSNTYGLHQTASDVLCTYYGTHAETKSDRSWKCIFEHGKMYRLLA